MFQSTLPRGERHNIVVRNIHFGCFNPRSRAGSDSQFITFYFAKINSAKFANVNANRRSTACKIDLPVFRSSLFHCQ